MSSLIINILEEFLGPIRKYNESSGQISFDCVSCQEIKGLHSGDGKGNLECNITQGVFNCWSCGAAHGTKGPISKLIKRYGTKKNLRDYLLIKPDSDYKKDNKNEESDEEIQNIVDLPEGFKLFKNCTSEDYKYEQAIGYLRDRGITDEIINEFDIGYTTKGNFFNRIIIPSYDEHKNINYFIARSFDKKTKPKYLNPDSEKQAIIFNEYNINWDATIYLEEGAFDGIVTPNPIVLLGKVLSDKLKYLIYTKAKGLIVILLDEDAYEDAVRLYKELNFGDLQGRIRIIIPPYKHDPSSIFEKLGPKGVVKLLRNSRKLRNNE